MDTEDTLLNGVIGQRGPALDVSPITSQPALGWRLPDSVIQLKLIPSHCPVLSVRHSQKSAVLTARLQGGDPANWSSFREH